jgi:hypothetical protein
MDMYKISFPNPHAVIKKNANLLPWNFVMPKHKRYCKKEVGELIYV